jgi:hypothetical protein
MYQQDNYADCGLPIDTGVSVERFATMLWVKNRLSIKNSKIDIGYEEWCLLGCYAVWLL